MAGGRDRRFVRFGLGAVAAAAAWWALGHVSADAVRAAAREVAGRVAPALATNASAAAIGWVARTVTAGGAVAGAAIGAVVFAALGWRGWALLVAAFALAALATRVGLRRKRLLGIAEDRGGQRGPASALANTGLAAAVAALALATSHRGAALAAFTAALVAGASDTVASEIGKAHGRHTHLITTFARVRPGAPGGVSWEGTFAGIMSAALLAAFAVALRLIPAADLTPVVVAVTAASLVESALGATLEARGLLSNDLLNLLNTAIAAALVLVTRQALASP